MSLDGSVRHVNGVLLMANMAAQQGYRRVFVPVADAAVMVNTPARYQWGPTSALRIRVQSWLDQPCVRLIQTTDQHWPLFQQMLRAGNATANLVSDAHLAALAVEHNGVLHSTDTDFARFRGLKWKNPIAS